MINRVLIRTKVVQLLYSYLLVESPFSLESQPTSPTKEKRFAYGLYLDMLCLMVNVAEKIEKRGGVRPLYDTRFITRVVADDKMKSLRQRYRTHDFPFKSVENELADEIKDSGIYKRFLKSDLRGTASEDNVWIEIFDHIINVNPALNALIASRENYSLKGVDTMKELIKTTFSNFFASADHLPDALAQLEMSLAKARELFMRMLRLPIEITNLRERQIDDSQHKLLKTEEDINPNMRFVENEFVKALEYNTELHKYLQDHKIDMWKDSESLIRSLLRDIMQSEVYYDYMNFPATDFINDCEFWRNLYKYVIFNNQNLIEDLEDKSVFWNDDLDIMGTFLLKTVRRFERDPNTDLLPMYKDQEDAEFGATLFSAVINHKDEYRQLIDEAIDRRIWESERLSFMDVVVVMTAVAEIMTFPKIPLQVTVNEYIEIAKAYSSSKSGIFVHGLLADIIDNLQAQGRLLKQD